MQSIATPPSPEFSLIIPCYNEEEVLPLLETRLLEVLPTVSADWEVVFVDDGSRDQTFALLLGLHSRNPRFKVLSFSRNFGHQAALSAGIQAVSGRYVGIIDADLQDPPELLLECVAHLRSGYHVAYAIRAKRTENFVKRLSYALFYRLLRRMADIDLPLDSGDFCVMDRSVVEVLRRLPERNLFLRGMRAWSGFRQIGVAYDRPARAAGETKYPFRRLVRLALDGIFSLSTAPLRAASYLGLFSLGLASLSAVGLTIWHVSDHPIFGATPRQARGWASLMVVILLLNGIQMLMLGVIGEYLGRIYQEAKHRPRWIIRQAVGIPHPFD
jgi:glycosyltransferase involved in cell wall biosynthesis